MTRPSVVFLIAVYRNDDEVLAFLRQLGHQVNTDFAVYAVCNESKDHKKFMEDAQEFSFVTVLFPKQNLGYFGAAHFALEQYKLTYGLPPLAVICNTDLEISDRNFLDSLLKYIRSNNVAAVGPSVISSFTGKDMNPYLTEPYSKGYLRMLKSVYSFYPIYAVYELTALAKSKLTGASKAKRSSKEAYAVYGAFVALTKAFFERGGSVDHGAFLYGEEIFVAEQARRLGMKVLHDNSLRVVHREHSTTGYLKSPRHVRYLHDSIAFILKSFYDEP